MKKDLVEHINAAFSGLWVQTHQADEAEAEIRQAAKEQGWELAAWDIATVSVPQLEPRVSLPVIRWVG